jgi:hypothetical protein
LLALLVKVFKSVIKRIGGIGKHDGE